jgi:hypothetical protein
MSAFQDFVRDVRERCEEPPANTSLQVVGSYRLL